MSITRMSVFSAITSTGQVAPMSSAVFTITASQSLLAVFVSILASFANSDSRDMNCSLFFE